MAQVKSNVEQLEELYNIHKVEQVEMLLTPQIVDTLVEAVDQIYKYFPKEKLTSKLSLGVQTFDDEPGYRRLAVLIIVDPKWKEARNQLDKFLEDWYFDLPAEIRLNLSIFVDYVDEF
jgi:hypothetical protein